MFYYFNLNILIMDEEIMMKKKLNCILLVDDDESCNYYHQVMLKKMNCAEKVYLAYDGKEALDYIQSSLEDVFPMPDIIFLDINMPGVNGWEFMEAYEKLDEKIKQKIVVVMLTSSLNPDDMKKASKYKSIVGFKNKYLEKEVMADLIRQHFPGYF